MLFSLNVEILLNFAWIGISLALIGWQVRISRVHSRRVEWRVLVALGLLLMLLLPVISITDDLMAMNTAVEVEHFMRRHLDVLPASALLTTLEWTTAAVLLLGWLRQRHFWVNVQHDGMQSAYRLLSLVPSYGVRPPPVFSTL